MKYIIVPISGCPLPNEKTGLRECGHDKWDMNCSFNERAVYYTRYDEERKCDVPTGAPILFLRQHGMYKDAEILVDLANREEFMAKGANKPKKEKKKKKQDKPKVKSQYKERMSK